MERLVGVSQELSLARDMDGVMAIVRSVARELTGADGATFVLRDGERCYYADEDAIAPLWKGRRFPLEACISGWVMQHREAVAIEDIYQDSRVPADAYRPTFVSSLAMVPIRRRDPVGAIGNYWASRHQPSDDQIELLQALADLTSVALENVQRVGELEERAHRDELLARAAAVLSSSLDLDETLTNVAALAVPALADWCALDIVGDGGLAQVAVAHRDPARSEKIRRARAGARWSEPPLGAERVIRGGAPVCGDGDQVPGAARELDVGGFIAVPVQIRGEIIGALTLVASVDSERRLGGGDVAVAAELARRCATAIDNARLYARAREAIRVRDELMAVASHELRTPVAAHELKLARLQILAAEAGVDGEIRETIDRTRASMARLSKLVQSVLDMSRLHEGRLVLDREPLDLVEVVGEVVSRHEEMAEAAGCALEVTAPAPVTGRWDRIRIEQVMTNLISNALKFGSGAPVEISVGARGETATLSIRDHGDGLAPGTAARILGKYERASSTRKYGGLGLGLYIAAEIVRLHGGTLEASGEPGKGATFVVELPRER